MNREWGHGDSMSFQKKVIVTNMRKMAERGEGSLRKANLAFRDLG